MRPLIATACVCLLASAGSVASDQKTFTDRFEGSSAVAPVPAVADAPRVSDSLKRTADRLAPPNDAFDPLQLSDTPTEFMKTAEAAIDIPTQEGTAAILAPRDLPMPPAPAPKPVVHRSAQEVCDTLTRAAQRNDLPVSFFIRLLFQESGFKPGAVSRTGAQGIAQFMPKTADAMGLDNPFDPIEAIPASARLLRSLFDQFGNLGLAAAAYNAGPKRIHDWLSRKGKLPEETQGYVKTITGKAADSWKDASAGTPAIKVPQRAPCQDAAGLLAYNGPDAIPVPPAAPRRAALLVAEHRQHQNKKASVKVAAQHHGRGKDTVNLAARRKTERGHHKAGPHRVASAK
ncbi:MAG TPA: lytic transglycosylase domain-containing protein [Pseudolabrys sp.]|jgi:soluble lytic murein transglycosylase-like protein|nr:lytic transglycosylase domain-containing protein [Pseudolabrys sp.]